MVFTSSLITVSLVLTGLELSRIGALVFSAVRYSRYATEALPIPVPSSLLPSERQPS